MVPIKREVVKLEACGRHDITICFSLILNRKNINPAKKVIAGQSKGRTWR